MDRHRDARRPLRGHGFHPSHLPCCCSTPTPSASRVCPISFLASLLASPHPPHGSQFGVHSTRASCCSPRLLLSGSPASTSSTRARISSSTATPNCTPSPATSESLPLSGSRELFISSC